MVSALISAPKVTKKYVDREELLYSFVYVALAARKGDVPG
jgi:hypothetical protein